MPGGPVGPAPVEPAPEPAPVEPAPSDPEEPAPPAEHLTFRTFTYDHPQFDAEALVAKAHHVCPYSNATRNNVDVRLSADRFALERGVR